MSVQVMRIYTVINRSASITACSFMRLSRASNTAPGSFMLRATALFVPHE